MERRMVDVVTGLNVNGNMEALVIQAGDNVIRNSTDADSSRTTGED